MGQEVNITYGDEKGACEMLFSYGFLEDEMDTAETLFLSLSIPDDDVAKAAKMKVRAETIFRPCNELWDEVRYCASPGASQRSYDIGVVSNERWSSCRQGSHIFCPRPSGPLGILASCAPLT